MRRRTSSIRSSENSTWNGRIAVATSPVVVLMERPPALERPRVATLRLTARLSNRAILDARRLCQRSGMTPERLSWSGDLLGQLDEDGLGPSDVAEPIHVFVLDHFADQLRAESAVTAEGI